MDRVEDCISFVVGKAAQHITKRAREKLAPFHVTPVQYAALKVLWEQDGITQRELSRRVGITEPTAVKGIAGLESAGLVMRETDKADKRKMIVSLSTRGRSLKKKLMPMVVEVNERALEGISASDIEITRRVLQQAYFNLTGDEDE